MKNIKIVLVLVLALALIAVTTYLRRDRELQAEPALYVKFPSREPPLTPTIAASIATVIQADGLNCPAAKFALFARGEHVGETVVKVFCGPTDREGVDPNAVFRVTILPADARVLAEPWERTLAGSKHPPR